MSPLLLLVGIGLGGYLAVWRNKRALKAKTRRSRKRVEQAKPRQASGDNADNSRRACSSVLLRTTHSHQGG